MKSPAFSSWLTVCTSAAFCVADFLLGAFAWFGGYGWVNSLVGGSVLGIGLVVAAYRFWVAPRRWPSHVLVFAGLQLVFFFAIAAGQVFYAGPGSVKEATALFGTAVQGGL